MLFTDKDKKSFYYLFDQGRISQIEKKIYIFVIGSHKNIFINIFIWSEWYLRSPLSNSSGIIHPLLLLGGTTKLKLFIKISITNI